MLKRSLKINNSIYSKDAINQAIEAYKEIVKINFSSGILTVDVKKDENPEKILNEFMNYVLALQNESI